MLFPHSESFFSLVLLDSVWCYSFWDDTCWFISFIQYAVCKHSRWLPVADVSEEGKLWEMPVLYEICSRKTDLITHLVKSLQDLSTGWLQCDPGPLFKPEYYPLPRWVNCTFCLLCTEGIFFFEMREDISYVV